MLFELSGKFIEKMPVQQISSTFSKREFIVETTEEAGGREFIELIKFQLINDKCAVVDQINEGDMVKISFNIKGRKWESPDGRVNYFTNLNAWRVEKMGAEQAEDPFADAEPPDDIADPEPDYNDVPF